MPIDKEMLRKLEVCVAVTWWGTEVNTVIVIHFKVKVSRVGGLLKAQIIVICEGWKLRWKQVLVQCFGKVGKSVFSHCITGLKLGPNASQ